MKFQSIDPLKYFWDRVEKRGPDDCWHWIGGYFSSGYGYRASFAGSDGPMWGSDEPWPIPR